jgi:hypothetical protein
MKQYDKIYVPCDGEDANVWFEIDRFQLPMQEHPNVIVLTKNEYYKELYFKQDFAKQQSRLIELEHRLSNIRDLLSGEPSEENVSEAYSIANEFLRQKLTQQTT